MEQNDSLGWVKLWKKIAQWEWYDDPITKSVFLHFVIFANHEPKKWHGILVERGQLLIGRRKLSKQLGITERNLRTSITRLKTTHEVTTKTTNKFTIVSICNYEKYQEKRPTERPTEWPTNDQQTTTTKEYKNIKKNKEYNAPARENVKELEESTEPANKGASSASSTPSLLTPSSAAPLGSEVNSLLGEIQAKLNPSLNFASKSQRSAAQRLLKAHTLASLVKAVEYAAKVRGKEFAPLIDSALALADKFEKLKEYAKRNPETTSQNPNDKIVAGVKVRLLTHDDNA